MQCCVYYHKKTCQSYLLKSWSITSKNFDSGTLYSYVVPLFRYDRHIHQICEASTEESHKEKTICCLLTFFLYGNINISEVLDHSQTFSKSLNRWQTTVDSNIADWFAIKTSNHHVLGCWGWEADVYSQLFAQSVQWHCWHEYYLMTGKTD